MLIPLDELLSDGSILPYGFNALHEKLSGGGHESNGNGNGTEANPRVGLRFRFREIAFHFSKGFWGSWVELESIALAGRVV